MTPLTWTALASLLVLSDGASAAACTARSAAADRLHLVELYTSEGCSSCPPAERWFSRLRDQPALVGLEYHVDYWDSREWRDPYADARFTERQKRLVEHDRTHAQVYTPQIAVDGRIWKEWPKGRPPEPAAADAPTLALEVERGATLQARVDASAASGADYRVYVALAENGLSNAVTGGENRGAKLAHDQVVRAFAGPLPLGHTDVELTPPAGVDLAQSTLVAFAQNERDGTIAQVVRVPLAGCAN
ncbi:MAG TPA: DUF1223 domain-containing protein [Dokdonella sp.]